MMKQIVGITLCLLLSLGCSALSFPSIDVGTIQRPTFVQQHTEHDCGVAVIAMLADTSYEDVASRVKANHISLTDGMSMADFVKLAASYGKPVGLVPNEKFNPVYDNGILVVEYPNHYLHAVLVHLAYVYDPARDYPVPWVTTINDWKVLYSLRRTT